MIYQVALRNCGYPEWALQEGEQHGKKRQQDKKEIRKEEGDKPKGYAVLPYMKGVSERLQRSFKKRNISLYHKAGQTLRQLLVHPKDKMEPQEQCGVV